jgi:hypothetical protein
VVGQLGEGDFIAGHDEEEAQHESRQTRRQLIQVGPLQYFGTDQNAEQQFEQHARDPPAPQPLRAQWRNCHRQSDDEQRRGGG